MKKLILWIVLMLGMGWVPAAFAQNHGEIGVFADYFRLQRTKTNNLGLGGRFSVNVHPNLQLEAEMAYDFSRGFNESFTSTGSPTASVNRSNVRILHGLFGPKLQTGGQAIRVFGTLKGGFVNFRFDNRPATFGTFASSVDDLRTGNVHGVFYPGAGIEFFAGVIGLRFDVGDEMYFSNGAHNNLGITVGPTIRF